jgi:hypothetical protein
MGPWTPRSCTRDRRSDRIRLCSINSQYKYKIQAYNKHTYVIRSLLVQLSSQCLNNATSTHYSLHDPTQIELQQQAVASYFSRVGIPKGHDETAEEDVRSQILDKPTSSMSETSCEVSFPELHKEIMSCLANPIYDVRITVLKRILQLVKSIRCGDSKNILHQCARAKISPQMIMERLFLEAPQMPLL